MIPVRDSKKRFVIFISFLFTLNVPAFGETFSCSFGKRPACLDYGDKVCSSFAKCVDNNAKCFNSYTCGYKGFVCKSKFDDLADEYDGLLRKCKNIATEHDNVIAEYNSLLRKYKNAVSEHEDLQNCVSFASSLDRSRIR